MEIIVNESDANKEMKKKHRIPIFMRVGSPEYDEIYRKDILPIFDTFEYQRRGILHEFYRKSFLKYFLPIIICGFLLLISLSQVGFLWGVITCFSGLGFIALFPLMTELYLADKKEKNIKFTNKLKKNVLQNLLKVFGDIKWRGHNTVKENSGDELLTNRELNESGLFVHYNTRYTDDEFEGVYKGVPFKISETRLLDSRAKDPLCVFKGIVLSFQSNKKINNRTVVATKGDFTKKNQAFVTMTIFLPICFDLFRHGYAHWKLALSILILVGAFVVSKLSAKDEEALDKVSLEASKFSRRFNVYSSDQVEARYLVTTAFMDRFDNLKTVFGTNNIKCSFFGGTLMIAIETEKNIFEICNLFKSLKDPSSISEFYRELVSIYKMIDYLKLDNKIGL